MDPVRTLTFTIDDETRTILREEAARRAQSVSGLLRLLVHMLHDGKVVL